MNEKTLSTSFPLFKDCAGINEQAGPPMFDPEVIFSRLFICNPNYRIKMSSLSPLKTLRFILDNSSFTLCAAAFDRSKCDEDPMASFASPSAKTVTMDRSNLLDFDGIFDYDSDDHPSYSQFIFAFNMDNDCAIVSIIQQSDLCVDNSGSRNEDRSNLVVFSDQFESIERLYTLFNENHCQKDAIQPAKRFSMIIHRSGGYALSSMVLNEKNSINLELNYGNDFLNIHENVIKKLEQRTAGLYLFYGEPGTGKTTYIKHLLETCDRHFIFIPVGHIEALISPDLLPLLIRHPGSILIIEDAEKALINRTENPNTSLVSALLNLSDGLIGKALELSVVATFNTDERNIDPALLRRGRTFMKYEFKKLSIANAQKLVDSLNKNFIVKEPMSLADIYYLEDSSYMVKKQKLGFA